MLLFVAAVLDWSHTILWCFQSVIWPHIQWSHYLQYSTWFCAGLQCRSFHCVPRPETHLPAPHSAKSKLFFFFFVYKSLLPKLEKLSENLCLQELPRIKKSLEGEARFILAFLKCSKSESTRMVKGDLLILSCSQLVTWAHLDNILKVTSSCNKRSFKSCDSYFPKRHAEGNRANPVSGETLWMSKKRIQ